MNKRALRDDPDYLLVSRGMYVKADEYEREMEKAFMPMDEDTKAKLAAGRQKKAERKKAAEAKRGVTLAAQMVKRAAINEVLYKEGATSTELYAGLKESSRLMRAAAGLLK